MKAVKNRWFLFFFILFLVYCSPSEKQSPSRNVNDSTEMITSPPPPPPPVMMNDDHNESISPVMMDTAVTRSVVVEKRIQKSITAFPVPIDVQPPTATAKASINNHDRGLLAYDIPDTMEYRKWYNVRFRINRDVHDTVTIVSKLSNVTVHDVKVSAVMEVMLTDPHGAFQIVKSNDDRQAVDTTEYTEWVYDIFPLKGGKHPLHVVVSVVINGIGKELVYVDDVWVRTSIGKVVAYDTRTFFEKYWQWIVSTLVIPLIVWWYNKKKKKKKAVKK